MRKMNGIAILVLAALVLAGISVMGAAAPLLSNSGGGNWQYNKDITINNAGNSLTDYQVLVSLTGNNFPADAQTSGADVRFMDAGGNELSYWIESWDYAGKSGKIWVKVPSIPAGGTTIRMYYGNPSASSSSNGDTTFIFFDDFETDLNKWTVTGNAVLSTVQSKSGAKSVSIDSTGSINSYIEHAFSPSLNNVVIEFWFWDNPSDTNAAANSILLQNGVNLHGGVTTYDVGQNIGWYDGSWHNSGIPRVNGWSTYQYQIKGNVDLRFNNNIIFINSNRITALDKIEFNANLYYPILFYIDTLRIRKYASPEPSVSLSTEQPVSTPIPTLPAPTTPAPTTPTPTSQTTGTISVSSSPSSASIYLDGVYQGETSKNLTSIPQGLHAIELRFAGYEDWSQNIGVTAGGNFIVSVQLKPLTTPTYTTPTTTPTYTIPPPPVDTSPPSISISKQIVDFNKNGQLDEGEKLVITYGANDESGVKSIKVLVDGNLIELRNNEGIYSVTTDSLSMGDHSMVVEAIDSKGNKKSEEMKINAARAGPSVYFPKSRYEVNEGEDVNVVLSAVNPIGNPKMDALLILKPPGIGISTYETDCKGFSGQCTGKFEIEPGDSVRSVSTRMRADRAGEYQVDAEVYYQFENGQRSPTRYETLTVDVKPKQTPNPTNTQAPSTPGFGGGIAIIGVLFMAIYIRKRF